MNSITRRWVRAAAFCSHLLRCAWQKLCFYTLPSPIITTARPARAVYAGNALPEKLSAMGTQTEEAGVPRCAMVEQLMKKDRFELMLMGGQGQMAVSSTGFSTADQQGWSDVAEAYASEEGIGPGGVPHGHGRKR